MIPLKNDYGSSGYDSTGQNQIRYGKVVDRRITNTGAQVQVQYTDRDGVRSDWLPCGQMGSKGTIFYSPPYEIGAPVVVAHFPTGIERGVVLCSTNSVDNPSFTPRSIDAFGVQFKDGSYFEYDPVAGCFSINGLKTAYINTQGQVQLIAGGDVDVTSSGNINATCSSGTFKVVANQINLNGVIINSAGKVTTPTDAVVGGNATVDGSSTVDGNSQAASRTGGPI